jgi:hypothetical protein
MKPKHHMPPGREAEYLAWCERMAETLGTTREDVMDQVDLAVEAKQLPPERRTLEQKQAFKLAQRAGFVE